MYEVRKSRILTEDLALRDGDRKEVIHVELNVAAMAREFYACYAALQRAGRLAKSQSTENATAEYGEAVIKLFNMLFGKEDTERILNFYDGDYATMIVDIFPFIQNIIMPKIKAFSEDALRNINREKSRQKRRKFFK